MDVLSTLTRAGLGCCTWPCTARRVKGGDQVPQSVDRTFHPYTATPQQKALQSSSAQVSGPQHYKFHCQPVPPAGADAATARRATQLASVRLAALPRATPRPPVAPEPAAKEAGTQSDFRESEAQTLPWTPDYLLSATSSARAAKQAAVCEAHHTKHPELLQLADLKWGDGLPGTGWEAGHESSTVVNGACSALTICIRTAGWALGGQE